MAFGLFDLMALNAAKLAVPPPINRYETSFGISCEVSGTLSVKKKISNIKKKISSQVQIIMYFFLNAMVCPYLYRRFCDHQINLNNMPILSHRQLLITAKWHT